MSTVHIGQGAKGYIVRGLQIALNLRADGEFGPKTAAAVRDVQLAAGLDDTGNADIAVYKALSLPFPSEFERCLAITDQFEGTGFGGINARDIDGAGVTLGIVGFTTAHGEVQRLVTEFIRLKPEAIRHVSSPAKEKLLYLSMASGRNVEAWNRWFYGSDGVVDPWIKALVASWGEDELFRRLQLSMVDSEHWKPAYQTAVSLGLENDIHALGLLFDTQVQNGGFKECHRRHYNALSHDGSVRMKLKGLAESVAACSNEKWRHDVGLRKMVFVSGGGTVHGEYFDLEDYGFGSVT